MKMQSMKKHGKSRRERRGSALIIAMFLVLIMAFVIGAVMSDVMQETRQTHRARVMTNSLAASKTTLNQMKNSIVHIARTRPPQQTEGIIENLPVIMRQVAPIAPPGSRIEEDDAGRPLAYVRDIGPNDFEYREITDPSDRWFGYSTARIDFELAALVSEDTNVARRFGFQGVGTKSRVVVDYVPLYQFAIFYEPDLELHPGPQMDIRGRVHSNQDLMLSAVNRVRFHEQVTSAGRILRYPYENQSGDVQILDRSMPTPQWVSMRGSAHPTVSDAWLTHLTSNWFEAALSGWDGNVRDVAHGISPLNPPLPAGSGAEVMIQRAASDDVPALRATKFEYLADLIISGNPDDPSSIQMYIPEKNAAGELIGLDPVDSSIVDDVVSVGEFYDGQQLTVVKTLDIDVDRLRLTAPVDFEEGSGAIYVSTNPGIHDSFIVNPGNRDPIYRRRDDGSIIFDSRGYPQTDFAGWRLPGRSNFMPAVRLKNGTRLPRNSGNGFAIYTDRPMYVAGNFNTQQTVTAVLGGDSITVTAYEQQLATRDMNSNGVLEANDDGVRINNGHTRDHGSLWHSGYNWDYNVGTDGRNAASRAQNTTTNAILLMGNAPSQNSNLISGGAHNVIRYLEDWSGRTHTFEGSIIVLFHSEVAVLHNRARGGVSTNQNYYRPPNRDYRWDDSLRRSEPPPGMPVIIEVFEYPIDRVEPDYIAANVPGGGGE